MCIPAYIACYTPQIKSMNAVNSKFITCKECLCRTVGEKGYTNNIYCT